MGATALLAVATFSVSVLLVSGLIKLHMRSAPAQNMKVAGTAGRSRIRRTSSIYWASPCWGASLLPSGKPIVTGVNTAPGKGPPVCYGEYILSYQDCRECHGQQLTGGVPGQLGPIGPDLSIVKDWKREEFIATLRTGTDPPGHELSERMPWRAIGKMDDDELTAI